MRQRGRIEPIINHKRNRQHKIVFSGEETERLWAHPSTRVARDTLPVGPGDPPDGGTSGTLAREDGYTRRNTRNISLAVPCPEHMDFNTSDSHSKMSR